MSQLSAVADKIALTVNGEARSIPADWTVADLLSSHGLDPQMVVVEHNKHILRDRAALALRPLAAGDSVEIVHFVGGG